MTAVDGSRKVLTVASLGRDQVTALRAGDLVEIADDASELGPNRGHLTYLTADPNPDLFTLQLADPIPPEFDVAKLNERHLLLRRWDGVGWAGDDFDDPGMQDLVGGRIDFLCDIIATAKPQIDGGKVKGIAMRAIASEEPFDCGGGDVRLGGPSSNKIGGGTIVGTLVSMKTRSGEGVRNDV